MRLLPYVALLVLCACSSRDTSPQPSAATPAPSAATQAASRAAAETARNAPPAAVPPSQAPPAREGREVLLAAFRAAQTNKTRVRGTLTAADERAQSTSWVIEQEPPDRRLMIVSSPAGESRVLVIGEELWTRTPRSAQWKRMPSQATSRLAAIPRTEEEAAAALERGSATVERTGEQTLDGQTVGVYRVRWTDTRPGAREPTTMTGRAWIGPDERLRRFEGELEGRADGRVNMTFEYDESIRVQDPPR